MKDFLSQNTELFNRVAAKIIRTNDYEKKHRKEPTTFEDLMHLSRIAAWTVIGTQNFNDTSYIWVRNELMDRLQAHYPEARF